jgi:hypothetical protein
VSLEAEIAKIQLNSLPPSIVGRLLKRRDIGALIEVGSAEIGNVGQFRFSNVRDTLATAPLGALVPVPTPVGHAISVARSSDAMVRVQGPSGGEAFLPELSLLDPSAEIRFEGVKRLAERARPQWPKSARWKELVAHGPLADSDFGLVLDELSGVAEPVLDGIVSKILGGQFGVLNLVPTNRTYYESLLGPIPWTTGVSQYVADILLPHLIKVFRMDSVWGLRCLHAASADEAVDPLRAAADVSNDDIISAIEANGIGSTPFALFATYRIASARAATDDRFSLVAQQALQSLTAKTCASGPDSGLDILFIALVRLTLGVVGQAEELASAPPFWRRLAAFAHAAVVLEAIGISDESAKEIAAWCAERRTREGAAVEILDHLVEPGWRSDGLSAGDLWATALLRAIKSAPGDLETSGLSAAQLEQARPRLELVVGTPGPLGGARQDWSTSNVQVVNEDLLDSVDSASAGGETLAPVQIWMALAHHAQIYRFSVGLLARVRGMAQTLKPQAGGKVSDIYTPLALCCNVASTQADLELADVAAAAVIEACGGTNDPAEATLAASIVILAAGAAKDHTASIQWASDQLLALAYRLPRGACCAALAETIMIFQRLTPLSKRRWGKALVVANSAAA